MSRYELSVSPNYVKDWTLTDAIREIFQNAIDQEESSANSYMDFTYNQAEEEFQILSSDTSLSKSSLLFGNTTKDGDDSAIGKFGEGYKLALLVLLREQYQVTIYNNKIQEIWTPKFIKSKRYDSEILVIDIKEGNQPYNFRSSLVFSIQGITEFDYHQIKETCLLMQGVYKKIDTVQGEILLGVNQRGKIFVNGLFVCKCDNKGIKFGYNLKPEYLKLDRDRSMISTFDLTWLTSSLWAKHEDKEFVANLILEGVSDVTYLQHKSHKLGNETYKSFMNKHGVSAMPVYGGHNLAKVREQYPKAKQVIVSENTAKVIEQSAEYNLFLNFCEVESDKRQPQEVLCEFFAKHATGMSSSCEMAFDEIINLSADWS